MTVTIDRTEQVADAPYPLLLLADENPQLIGTYLPLSQIYLLRADGEVRGVCLLTTGTDTGEIVNVAIDPDFQGQGLGRRLLQHVINVARDQSLTYLFIKTANSGIHQIKLYQQLGFDLVAVNYQYFLENYPEPIYENGIQARHQLVFRLALVATN